MTGTGGRAGRLDREMERDEQGQGGGIEVSRTEHRSRPVITATVPVNGFQDGVDRSLWVFWKRESQNEWFVRGKTYEKIAPNPFVLNLERFIE